MLKKILVKSHKNATFCPNDPTNLAKLIHTFFLILLKTLATSMYKNTEKNTKKFTEKNAEKFFCIFFCKFFRIFFCIFIHGRS